jgi:hypothetical protein
MTPWLTRRADSDEMLIMRLAGWRVGRRACIKRRGKVMLPFRNS